MVRLGLLWTISDLLVVTTGFSGSKSCRGVVRELPASSGAPFPDIFENVGPEIWKSGGPFRAIVWTIWDLLVVAAGLARVERRRSLIESFEFLFRNFSGSLWKPPL